MSKVDRALHRDAAQDARKTAKRARSEDIATMLDRVIERQEEQTRLLERLGGVRIKLEEGHSPLSLEEALAAVVRAYLAQEEGEEERPQKLRRLLGCMAEREQAVLREVGYVIDQAEPTQATSHSDSFGLLNPHSGHDSPPYSHLELDDPEEQEDETSSPNPGAEDSSGFYTPY